MVAGLMKVGAGDGSDFSVTIVTGGEVVTETGFRDEAQVSRDYDPLQDRVSTGRGVELQTKVCDDFMYVCMYYHPIPLVLPPEAALTILLIKLLTIT